MAEGKAPLIVGIAGGSASGKTTLATTLATLLGADYAVVLEEDDYQYDFRSLPGFDPKEFDFDNPAARDHELLASHLSALRHGATVSVPRYSFRVHGRIGVRSVSPRPVVIIEGIHVLTSEKVRGKLDLAIYLDAPDDVRLIRRLIRDTARRGRSMQSVVRQHLKFVRINHHKYIAAGRKWADLVLETDAVDTSSETTRSEDIARPLADLIRQRLAKHTSLADG